MCMHELGPYLLLAVCTCMHHMKRCIAFGYSNLLTYTLTSLSTYDEMDYSDYSYVGGRIKLGNIQGVKVMTSQNITDQWTNLLSLLMYILYRYACDH